MGTLRFYLAVCVFIWHCYIAPDRFALHSFAAVYCFFIMSGFLMSLTLLRDYPETREGTLRFYANRALRLFPTYWVVLLATAVAYVFGFAPFGVPGLNSLDFVALLDQITVLPHVIWLNLTLNTAVQSNTLIIGWYYTVGLEMMFYLFAPFFLRWKLPNLILLFVASGLLHSLPLMLGWPTRQWQYEFFAATMVFFVAGALSYRLYLAIKDTANRYVGWLLLIGVVIYGTLFDSPLYTNHFAPLALFSAFSLLLPFLFIASQNPYLKPVDKFLGDISYPFYVVHGLAAGLVGGGVGLPTNVLAGLATAVVLSIAIHLTVEIPIEKIRLSIKRRGFTPNMTPQGERWPQHPLLKKQPVRLTGNTP